jgi:hypothetical protein
MLYMTKPVTLCETQLKAREEVKKQFQRSFLFYVSCDIDDTALKPTNQPTKTLTKGGVLRKRKTSSLAR